ncbi:MAG TPA: hypothetical protein PKB14_05140 [Rubrivivax sp.]|nr:hypothetical protein [Rubrivivax sp.]
MNVQLDHLLVPSADRVAGGLAFRSLPHGPDDHQVNPAFGGRIVYWSEPDGHVWELLSVSCARRAPSASA